MYINAINRLAKGSMSESDDHWVGRIPRIARDVPQGMQQSSLSEIIKEPSGAQKTSSKPSQSKSKQIDWAKRSDQKRKWSLTQWRPGRDNSDVPIPTTNEPIGSLHNPEEFKYVGSPGDGVTYSEGYRKDMPNTSLVPGVYVRKSNGALHFVKTGLYRKTGDSRQVDPNSAARSEYTAHRIMGVLATKKNYINPIDARLHSDGLNGAQVPDGYKIHPHEGIYSVTQKIPHSKVLQDAKFESHEHNQRTHKELAAGFAVDALLGIGDLHGQNIMLSKSNPKGGYRIDTGAYLGMNPFGYLRRGVNDPSTSNFFRDQYNDVAFLPDMHEANRYLSFTSHLQPQEMLDLIKDTTDTYQEKRNEIIKEIQHHSMPDKLLEALDRRVASLKRTYDLYKNYPEQFAEDVARGNDRRPNTQEIARDAERHAEQNRIAREQNAKRQILRNRAEDFQNKLRERREKNRAEGGTTTRIALDPEFIGNAFNRDPKLFETGQPLRNAADNMSAFVEQQKERLRGNSAGDTMARARKRRAEFLKEGLRLAQKRKDSRKKFLWPGQNTTSAKVRDARGELTWQRLNSARFRTGIPYDMRAYDPYTLDDQGRPVDAPDKNFLPKYWADENLEQWRARREKADRAEQRFRDFQGRADRARKRFGDPDELDPRFKELSADELGTYDGKKIPGVPLPMKDLLHINNADILFPGTKEKQMRMGNLPDWVTGRRGPKIAGESTGDYVDQMRQRAIKINRALARRGLQGKKVLEEMARRQFARKDLTGDRFPELVGNADYQRRQQRELIRRNKDFETGGKYADPRGLDAYIERLKQRRKDRLEYEARNKVRYAQVAHDDALQRNKRYEIIRQLKNMSPSEREKWAAALSPTDINELRIHRIAVDRDRVDPDGKKRVLIHNRWDKNRDLMADNTTRPWGGNSEKDNAKLVEQRARELEEAQAGLAKFLKRQEAAAKKNRR